jgi:hypothetical protein
MKKVLTFILGLFITIAVTAQSYTFRVLANKGDNKIEKTTGQQIRMKTGAVVQYEDVLIIGNNSYVGLMYKTGKTIEIRKGGKFKVVDLIKNVNTGKSSVASRYAKFVSDKMNETTTSNYRARLNATGAVSRAFDNDGMIALMMCENNSVLQNNFTIKWEDIDSVTTYKVVITNIQDEIIKTYLTNETSVNVDITLPELENNPLYIVNVSDNDNPEIKSIDRGVIPKEEFSELRIEYEELVNDIGDNNSVLNKLVEAWFFEEKGLLLDALTKYEEIIELEPDVRDYQEMYDGFLLGYGFKK